MQAITTRLRQFLMAAIFGLTLAAINISAATFTVTNTNDSGAGSLRQAVLDANAAAGADTIVFDSSFNVPRTITLASLIQISPAATIETLTITGPGANLLTISGNNAVGIFQVGTGDTASFSGLTLTQGNVASGSGSAITGFGSLNISDSVFTANNDAAIDINNAASVSSITNCRFTQNLVSINIDTGTLGVTNSTFTQNQESPISNNGTLNVTNSTFDSNTANVGGAISNSGLLTVTDSTFTNNTVTSNSATGLGGGAICSFSTVTPVSATITNSTFTGNREAGRSGGGGAIRNRSGVMNISGSTFTNNSAIRSGGAVRNTDRMSIDNSTFTGNASIGVNDASGDGNGGAIDNFLQLTITNSLIAGNSAANSGGGISYNSNQANPFLNITNCTISNNRANTETAPFTGGSGGGIAIGSGAANIINSTIIGNTIVFPGNGGIFGGTVTLQNTIVANNSTSGTGQDISGVVNSLGYNLIRNTTGATISGITTGNITGVNPLLGPLSFNGGATRTHALLAGSPAIDTGDPTTFPATDQRGILRPQDGDGTGGARSDIGAYERRLTNDILANNPYDFDGDGKTDVSVFRPSNTVWYVSKSSDNNVLTAQWGIASDRLVPGDYNGDGKADYAVFRDGFWYVLLNGGGFEGAQWGSVGDVPYPADFDADGKTDLAVFRNGTWFVRKSSGGTITQNWGSAGDIPVVADYNGDGRADFGVYRNGIWFIQFTSGGDTAIQWGIADDKTVQADYNGDGRADYAVFRDGFWYILLNGGGFLGAQWGQTGDLPSPADYDGDGKTDLAVFRAGTWFIQRTTAGVQVVNFGSPGDKPVANAFVP